MLALDLISVTPLHPFLPNNAKLPKCVQKHVFTNLFVANGLQTLYKTFYWHWIENSRVIIMGQLFSFYWSKNNIINY